MILNADAQRYLKPVFDSVVVTPDIEYGFNYGFKGDSTKLFLDIYEPYGDTAVARPLLVLAHGGSFVQGSRKAQDITALCQRLCKMGYVAVSIQYRLGVDITSGKTLEQEFQQAVWRGTQDGRAAVRFMTKSIAMGNAYKLDPNQIYSGGISAGGVLGLHLAFLDQPNEVAMLSIDTNIIGGIEGNSGNPGYSWKVKGVISLCGALAYVSWINNNKDVSICNMHGTMDATVPYKTAYFKFFGANVALLQGGFSVDSAAQKQAIDTRLHTFEGANHVPFTGITATQQMYMDTTVDYVARYLYSHVTGLIPTAILEQKNARKSLLSYPNPAQTLLHVFGFEAGQSTWSLYDIQGKLLLSKTSSELAETIDVSVLPRGTYVLITVCGDSTQQQKIVLN
ncbi:MAG: T9SS type A sorting domain-containing protein [bacterium]|nr:T9SS type A sorting domain-containing protein [bacterium]